MTGISRRRFLASLAAAIPLNVVVRRAHAAAVRHLESDPATLDALGEAMLPSQLGRTGISRAVGAFRDWGKYYRENTELVHGYGTSRLRTTGPTPVTRWTSQLDALDSASQSKHGRPFKAATVAQRTDLVRETLKGERLDRMPNVAEANHVAIALLAHFYGSSTAADLCYEARIGRETCRPLALQSRKPLPLAGGPKR
jgi:gluconate 2-dehydrogenase subunit 3-like protein